MALTKDFHDTFVERIKTDSEFASALLDEAVISLEAGETQTACLALCDLVTGTIGFEKLAVEAKIPVAVLQSILSRRRKPIGDYLDPVVTDVVNRLQRVVNRSAPG
jgi:hypothetical protein